MKATILLIIVFLTGFSKKTMAMSDSGNNTILSITIASFTADLSPNDQVNLSWNTMMEFNVDHFEIQRSGDAMNFTTIDSLDSKMTQNTNSYQLQYNYTDLKALPGTSYYRLTVVGKNGNKYQSTIVRITISNIGETKIYPTLVQNNTVYIESGKNLINVKMEFFDLSGNIISETSWEAMSGKENVQVSRSGSVHPGTYIARLTANGKTVKNQIVIVQ